jgi:hypothetical protein
MSPLVHTASGKGSPHDRLLGLAHCCSPSAFLCAWPIGDPQCLCQCANHYLYLDWDSCHRCSGHKSRDSPRLRVPRLFPGLEKSGILPWPCCSVFLFQVSHAQEVPATSGFWVGSEDAGVGGLSLTGNMRINSTHSLTYPSFPPLAPTPTPGLTSWKIPCHVYPCDLQCCRVVGGSQPILKVTLALSSSLWTSLP